MSDDLIIDVSIDISERIIDHGPAKAGCYVQKSVRLKPDTTCEKSLRPRLSAVGYGEGGCLRGP
jgi:hypothetical protein